MSNLTIAVIIYAVLIAIQSISSAYHDASSERIAVKLLKSSGVDIENLDAVKEFFIKRCDPDRFGNRLADFVGVVWSVISTISAIIVGCAIVYNLYDQFIVHNQDFSDTHYIDCAAWSAFMYVIGVFISMVTKLLTNRYPSEPRKMRKYIRNNF